MEAVGVVALIGHALNDAKFGGIKTAEAIAEVFARRAVQAEAVAGLFFPAVDGVTQTSDDGDAFHARVAIVHMLITRQRVDGFVDADIAQRNGGATVLKISDTSSSAFRRTPQAPSMYNIGATRAFTLRGEQYASSALCKPAPDGYPAASRTSLHPLSLPAQCAAGSG